MAAITSRRSVLVSAAVACVIAMANCGGGPSKPSATVSSVTVAGASTTTVPGQTLQLTATANLSDGTTQNVTNTAVWSPANPAVASVTAGLVTALAIGDTAVTARHENVQGSATVSIKGVIARFVVTSPNGNDVCRIIDNGNSLDCTLNGTSSLGSPTTYSWTTVVGSKTVGPTDRPSSFIPTTCGLFDTAAPQIGTTGSVNMLVRLRVSKTGATSEEVTNQNVRLFPQKNCGSAF